MNIINFVKSQNLMYAGNILEGILIYIFNYSCKTSKEDYFGKFINKNFGKLRESTNKDLPNWFKNSKDIFLSEEIQDIEKLLSNDLSIKDKPNNKVQTKPIFHKLLFEIMKNKYEFLGKNNYNYNYINKEQINKMKIYLIYFDKYVTSNSSPNFEQVDYNENSIAFLYNNFILKNKCPIKIIYCFLISVYIYNQNAFLLKILNDPKLITRNPDSVENIKYTYQLKDYKVEGRFGNIITSPISVEPRIINIDFMQNNLRESSLFELGKILSFNKNIKSLNLKSCLIHDHYLDYFVKGFLFFDNDSLEELNLSKNRLKENSDFALSELIKHLRGLKTLNIFGNIGLKGGLRHFFITLKTLYKKGKTNLENLNINNCTLTDTSFYELGELLKSPYCGLKRLNVALNARCYTINFLKTLKFNRSLDELIIYNSDINDNDVDDICRIISNTNIKNINLFKNNFHIFGRTLRIIFRGKLIKDLKKKIKLQKNKKNINVKQENIEKIKNEINLVETKNNVIKIKESKMDDNEIDETNNNVMKKDNNEVNNEDTELDETNNNVSKKESNINENETDEININVMKREDNEQNNEEQNNEELEGEEQEEEESENEESEKEEKKEKEKKEKEKEKKEEKENTYIDLSKSIIHLDLGTNFFYTLNHHYIKLINDFVENYSTINCLDISHILYGKSPDLINSKFVYIYTKTVNELVEILTKRKNYFEKLILYKLDFEREIEIYKKKEDKYKLKDIDEKIEQYIKKIIKNKLSTYTMYLKEKSYEIIKKIFNNKSKYEKLIENEKIDEEPESENNENFINKLVIYMQYIRNKEEIIRINRELELKKLVII